MNKLKEKLFNLIGKEEVLLFVGAGMSRYAGYPSGEELANIIYNSLPKEDQRHITLTNDLAKLTNDIYYVQGATKKYLFKVLAEQFEKKPLKTNIHDLLSIIPQFKTIITTNYDCLIEKSHKNIKVIRTSSDYSKVDSKKQILFKIHGDLLDKSRIILTFDDYVNFFSKSQEDTIFWNAVKDRMASNHILFMGYSIDDSNIRSILSKIIVELGKNRKGMYYVSPSLSVTGRGFLKSNNIDYIKSTAEDFFPDLMLYFKDNYFSEVSKGSGTIDTAFKFAESNNLKVKAIPQADKIEIISEPNEEVQVHFKLNIPENQNTIKDIFNGTSLDEINIDGSLVQEISEYQKDFKIKRLDGIKSLIIKKEAFLTGPIQIHFTDGQVEEIENFELYGAKPNPNEIILKVLTFDFELKITLELGIKGEIVNFKVIIEPKKIISSTNSGMKFFGIMIKLLSSDQFRVYKNKKCIYTNTLIFSSKKESKIVAHEYLKLLQKIEKHFKVSFFDIEINEINYDFLEAILAYIDNTGIIETNPEINIPLGSITKKEFYGNSRGIDSDLKLVESFKTIINLHSIQFEIGYKNYILDDAYVLNFAEIKSGKSKIAEIRSKSNKVLVKYLDE